MSDRPIIFSGAMIRALLEGRKTQTRRLLRSQPEDDFRFGGIERDGSLLFTKGALYGKMPAPYAPGDRLYVRENWRTKAAFDELAPAELLTHSLVSFEADYSQEPNDGCCGKLRPCIHMPKWASRITLTVEAVKVERLQDISEADAKAEGIQQFGRFFAVEALDDWEDGMVSARYAFRQLWQSINAKRAPWDSNPWVVAISFKVIHGNIDSLPPPAPGGAG